MKTIRQFDNLTMRQFENEYTALEYIGELKHFIT